MKLDTKIMEKIQKTPPFRWKYGKEIDGDQASISDSAELFASDYNEDYDVSYAYDLYWNKQLKEKKMKWRSKM